MINFYLNKIVRYLFSENYLARFSVVVLTLLFFGKISAQCGSGTYNNNAWQICYQGSSTSTAYSLGTITAGQYARLAVVKGFIYRFTTCGIGFVPN